MDAEGVLRAAALQLAQEDDLAVDFADADVEVLDARVGRLHLVQFVVVGGKEGTGLGSLVFMDILYDGPGDGDAVVGAGSSAQFVEDDERAGREVVAGTYC